MNNTGLSDTATEILACARKLIAAGGYNGFSYADIAEVVGVRKASIHHHFPSKLDLVVALVAQYRIDTVAGLAAMERHVPGPDKQIRAYLSYWEKCIADGDPPICVCAMLASEMPTLPPEVADEVRGYFRELAGWLAGVLKRGAAANSLRVDGSFKAEAEAIMATVHGAMLSARTYGDPKMFALITHPLLARLLPAT